MKNLVKLAVPTIVAIAATFSIQSHAVINPAATFDFESVSGQEGGTLTISSTLNATTGYYDYIVQINNTSTNVESAGTGAAVTGFAFDFTPNFKTSMVVGGVTASRLGSDGSTVQNISAGWALTDKSNSVSGSSEDGTQIGKLSIDFIGDQTGNVPDYGIFNESDSSFDATVMFTLNTDLDLTDPFSSVLRLQRTGDGSGSLKLYDNTPTTPTTGNNDPAPVPEPSSLALLALGLIGMGLSRRRLAIRK